MVRLFILFSYHALAFGAIQLLILDVEVQFASFGGSEADRNGQELLNLQRRISTGYVQQQINNVLADSFGLITSQSPH